MNINNGGSCFFNRINILVTMIEPTIPLKICINRMERCNQQVKIIMQVHDELVFEVAEACLQSSIDNIREIMAGAAELDVPLVVDVGWGENWDEAH